MLLSAQADSYLLKIQGDRSDVDRIVQAHTAVCQNIQEISEDTFQWAIFVVGATLAEKLAIQNQVMSLTTDADGKKPSDSLLDVIEGLSGALQDLTNLTEDEQAYVMNKMARMGQASAPAAIAGTSPTTGPATSPARPSPTIPATRGPVIPGGGMPGHPNPLGAPGPGQPLPPVPGFTPGRLAPQQIPGRVMPGTPLPPVSIPGGLPGAPAGPGILRPAQPPKSFGPAVPQNPLPPVTLPKVSFPGVPGVAKPTTPAVTPEPPRPSTPAPSPSAVGIPIPMQTAPAAPPAPVPPANAPTHLPPQELAIEKKVEPLAASTEPPVSQPKPAATPPPQNVPSAPQPDVETSPLIEIKPAPPTAPAAVTATKQEEGQIQAAIFYPVEGEEWKTHFLNTLADIAQKKSKKPTHFKINAAVPGPIALENSAEWIWKSKTSGVDIFFVVLPPDLGSDLMEPVMAEAESAGLRCFLVPQAEINSKLLYMDLMVELMMFKKRIRPPAP